MNSEIIPLFNKHLKQDFTSQNYLDLTKPKISNILSNSFLRTKFSTGASQSTNPFTKIEIVSSGNAAKSKLLISLLKASNSKEYEIIRDIWLDGAKVKAGKNINNNIYVESPVLAQGTHQWAVKTYLIESRLKNKHDAAVLKYEMALNSLNNEYENETDPAIKSELLDKILNVQNIIAKLKSIIDDNKKELGSLLTLNFEVL